MVLLALGWLLAGPSALAQTTITGLVQDQAQHQAVPFANVVLKTAVVPSKVVQATLADANGHFTLQAAPGRYQFQVLQLGFATYEQALEVAAGQPAINVGSLALAPAPQGLSEVVVTGHKPLIEQKPDRITMNVDGSILATGNDAYNILAAAPTVKLIDGRLTFRGKGNVLILLNGKRLPGANLETVLAGIPGDQIERIELISNPSAKYDADATGGVIEIYTKRSKELGWTGNAGVNMRQGYRTSGGLNGGLRASTLKLDAAVSGSYNRRGGFERSTGDRTLYSGLTPMARLSQRSNLDKVLYSSSFSASLNYHPTSTTTVGGDVDIISSGLTASGGVQAVLQEAQGTTTSLVQQGVDLRNTFANYTIFGRHKLDSLGSSVVLSTNYATYLSRQQQTFEQQVQGQRDSTALPSNFRNYIPATYDISTTALDYVKHWKNEVRLESGLKYTDTRNHSRQEAETFAQGTWQPLPLTPFSRLGYQERVAAAYLIGYRTIGPWAMQAGLRAERTHYQVVSGIDSSYFNLFPNLRLDYKASADYTVSFAYARNLRRPAYESLIPYERYIDTYTTQRGNARLRPEYAQTFSWNNLYKGYGLQLAYTRTSGAISLVYLYDPATLRFISTEQNFQQRHLATITLNAPFNPFKWWASTNSAIITYQQLSFPNPVETTRAYTKRKTYVEVSTDNTISWGAGWSARLYASYNSPSFNGLFDLDDYLYASVGLKKTFWQKQASFSLSVVDLFYQMNIRVSSSVVPVVSSELLRNDTRQVRAALTYQFGKGTTKNKRVNPASNTDERGRLGM
jgi:outer membrane receptor protein involved in Fe transport